MIMGKSKKKLGEMLLEAGLIDEIQLNAALAYQKEWGGRVGTILIRKGHVQESDMIAIMEKQMGVSSMPLESFAKPPEEVIRMVKEDIARKFCIFPVGFDGRILAVATPDPTDLKMCDDLGFLLNLRIKPVLALESDILTAIDHFYDPLSSSGRLERISQEGQGKRLPIGTEFEIIHSHDQPSMLERIAQEAAERSVDSSVLGGLIDLLVKKGVITREELADNIRSRKQ
jgi:type IV pilus assembly protein PilB